MNRMKTNKEISVILSLVLCLALAISTPIFAASGNDKDNGKNKSSDKPYVENEAIVCYVDSEDVNRTVLEKEIEKTATAENVAEDDADYVSIDVDEQLELVDMVDDSGELMDLGDQPIEDMKHVKKNVIKEKKFNKGKAKQKMGLVKSKKYSTEQLVKKLKALPNVEFAEPNYIEKPTATADYTSNQWAYNTTYGLHVPNWNIPEIHNADGVVVAVLDTGVDYNNEDLKDIMWTKSTDYHGATIFGGGEHGIDTSATTTAGEKDPMDVDGHGSHCAGIIGAAWNGFGVSGAANGVKIMAVKAGDSDGFYSTDLVEGMEYILEAKKAGVNIVAVNNSWGGNPRSSADSYVTAMKNLGKEGVISVFASGNEYSDCDANYGNSNKPKYYQAYFFKDLDCKLVVNNSDRNGYPRDSSNWGATTTDVYAPGTSIYSTYLSSESPYANLSGTSMAAPAVAGEVAILRAAYPDATIQQIIAAIRNNVTPDGTKKKNKKLKACISGGYANVEKALNALADIGHDVSGQPWVYDDTNHWKVCKMTNCDTHHSEAAHVYNQKKVASGYQKTDATCTSAAVYYKSCVCGKIGTETFTSGQALGHNVSVWNYDSDKHWQHCDRCNSDVNVANHSGGTATCQSKAVCSACGQAYGNNGQHVYNQETAEDQYLKSAADCTTAAVYYKSCVCGDKGTSTFTSGKPKGHDVDGVDWSTDDTNHWKVCKRDRCGAKVDEAAHSGGDATCQMQAECKYCKRLYGNLASHDWQQGVGISTCKNCSAVKCDNNVIDKSDDVENEIVNKFKNGLGVTIADDDSNFKCLDISLAAGTEMPTQGITITIPFSWLGFDSGVVSDFQHYDFTVAQTTGEQNNIQLITPINVTSAGIEITVSELSTFAVAYTDKQSVPGDLDGDGSVTYNDVKQLCQELVTETMTPKNTTLADYNNDGKVDIYDAIAMRNAIRNIG